MHSVKNYILDTNVLLHDPNSILNFDDNNVLIPIEVIEEIDRFKRESTERGQNARTFSRSLDALRHQGHLSEGVRLSKGRLSTMGKPAARNTSRMRDTSLPCAPMFVRCHCRTILSPSSLTRLSGSGRSSLIRYQSKL